MFPIEAPELRRRICNEIIPTYLADNKRARTLRSDGTYVRVTPRKGEALHRSQYDLLLASNGELKRSVPTDSTFNGRTNKDILALTIPARKSN